MIREEINILEEGSIGKGEGNNSMNENRIKQSKEERVDPSE